MATESFTLILEIQPKKNILKSQTQPMQQLCTHKMWKTGSS